MQSDGTFKADEVLAKHDEKYMPPEVAKSLKRRHGEAREDALAAPQASPSATAEGQRHPLAPAPSTTSALTAAESAASPPSTTSTLAPSASASQPPRQRSTRGVTSATDPTHPTSTAGS